MRVPMPGTILQVSALDAAAGAPAAAPGDEAAKHPFLVELGRRARALRARRGPHDAEHVILECLGETIWRAQRQGGAMDADAYLDAVRRQAGMP